MGFFEALSKILKNLKRYNYLNDFYDVLRNGKENVDDSIEHPEEWEEDADVSEQDKKETLNWFKEACNSCRAEMDSELAEMYNIIDSIRAHNPFKGLILTEISIIMLRLYSARFWIQGKFFNKRFLERAGERAYSYMLENTGMTEEDEDE